jgi:hypothetical protein
MFSVLMEFFNKYDYQDVGNIINSLRQERPFAGVGPKHPALAIFLISMV